MSNAQQNNAVKNNSPQNNSQKITELRLHTAVWFSGDVSQNIQAAKGAQFEDCPGGVRVTYRGIRVRIPFSNIAWIKEEYTESK